MGEYTFKDVIIDSSDSRIEIGKEYYFGESPKAALKFANKKGRGAFLKRIDDARLKPFILDGFDVSFPCLVRKREGEERYLSRKFNFSEPEDRKELIGKAIYNRYTEETSIITGFREVDGRGICCFTTFCVYTSDELFENCKFLDGTPCVRILGRISDSVFRIDSEQNVNEISL